MPWLNADSKMHAHPKMRSAGLEAMGLWLVAGTYAADILSDGFVPDWYIDTWPKGHRLAAKLIDTNLWGKAEGGYQILSWSEYQRTKEQIEAERENARKRKQAYKERHSER